MKKRLLGLLLLSSIIATPVLAQNINNSDIKIIINGNNLVFEQPPIIENGRVLVPVRETFEALGAKLNWLSEVQSILAIKDNKSISLAIGSNQMYINDETSIELDVPAKMVENRTLVPLRAVSEAFDTLVNWNEATKTATITDNNSDLKITKLIKNFDVKSDDNTTVMTIKYNYPIIDNKDDDLNINQFNNNYEKLANKFIESHKTGELANSALEFYNDTLKEGFEFRPYTLENNYEVEYNKGKIISLTSTLSEYTGGAHPNYSKSGEVFDLNSNKKLELTDIINKSETEIRQMFIEGFSTLITEQPDSYFEDAKETVTKSADKINFYLSNKGLVFFFNPYDIAPYAAGAPEYTLTFDGNESLFKLDLK